METKIYDLFSKKIIVRLRLFRKGTNEITVKKFEFTSSRIEPKCCIDDESTVTTLGQDRYTWYLSNRSSGPVKSSIVKKVYLYVDMKYNVGNWVFYSLEPEI